jgi:ankyrin repeat protein
MNASAASQETIDQFVTAAHGNRAAVETALAADPSLINARSSLAESPLGAAAHVGNRAMAEYLLARGARPELPAAAMLGHVAEVEAAVRADPSLANAACAHGISILFHACIGGQYALARFLVAHGATNTPAALGSCLLAAVRAGHVEMARWLVNLGADVTTQDFEGKTALERAEGAGDAELTALLRGES